MFSLCRRLSSSSGSGSGGLNSLAAAELEVLEALRSVQDPILTEDIVQLNMVQDLFVHPEGGAVRFALTVPTLAHPGLQAMTAQCQTALQQALPWVQAVAVVPRARRPRYTGDGKRAGGLADVEHVIAVSSCKGGVGKSTVAVNLAYVLAAQGSRVGLLDADVYGPSLPTLISPVDTTLRTSRDKPGKLLLPISHEGVKCLSFGYVNPNSGVPGAGGRGAAVLRGPMVSKVITQLLVQTDWGELDHLIIDMPPGTGDIHITLCQTVQLSGAVIVTTPQKLSYVDVVKGIDMFSALKVPTLAVVENMAYFDCEHGTRYRPFGPGHAAELAAEYGIRDAFQLPLSERIASGSDGGRPIVTVSPAAEESSVYSALGRSVVATALRASHCPAPAPAVKYDAEKGAIVLKVISETAARLYRIPPRELRVREARTGLRLVPAQADAVPADVYPVSFDVKGNYAVGIVWSDGHRADIYPYDVLIKIGEELLQQ